MTTPTIASLTLLALATACDEKQADAQADAGDGDGGSAGLCVETTTVVELQQPGVTGIAAADVLAEVEGVYAGTITWLSEPPVTYQGSTAPTPLTLEIAYGVGEARSVDAELVESCAHFGSCPCEDRLEVDVTWRLISNDGVLDEPWAAPVVHEPTSYFMVSDLGIRHALPPDDASGSLDAGSFALDDGFVLRGLLAQADLASGAAQGSIGIEVEGMDWVGFGPAANFAAVREVTPLACNALRDERACSAAGGTVVLGGSVHRAGAGCECNLVQPYCFAGQLGGEAVPTLYTRVDIESGNEVVAFDALVDPPPQSWRLCAAAPDVPECGCPDVPTCP